MELREYLGIIKKDIKILFLGVVLVVLASLAYFGLRPVSYSVSMALNVTRNGSQQTADYHYDDFYRLQADEKFAETIVQWLNDPRIVTDIHTKAGIDVGQLNLKQLARVFNSEKLSSQIVAVSFSAVDKVSAKNISEAVAEVIESNVAVLNENQNESTWFRIIAQAPVIVKNKGTIWTLLVFPVLFGIFIGFWVIMLRHYLKNKEE
jgi:capsular polysaccharide biosynthesis protein